MAIHDIAYVESYVHDRPAAVNYFVSSFGFTKIAHCDETTTVSTYLKQSGVRLKVTSGPATEEFLEQHGDGVSDIAFT